MKDPTTSFSDRVENYVKYRPHYPAAMIGMLERHAPGGMLDFGFTTVLYFGEMDFAIQSRP